MGRFPAPFLSAFEVHHISVRKDWGIVLECCDYCRQPVEHVHLERIPSDRLTFPREYEYWNVWAHLNPDNDEFCTFWRKVVGGARA